MLEMLLLTAGGRQRVTQNFPQGSSTFTTPYITSIENIVGRGEDGQPGYSEYGYDTYETVETQYSDGSTSTDGPNFVGSTYYADPPPDSCTQTGGAYPRTNTCYTHTTFDNSTPDTTGADTTGFGVTFSGGVGQAAVQGSFANVSVSPNTPYTVNVAPGGELSITYWK